MDPSFSPSDRLRAMACCFPNCRLLPSSPSSESLRNDGELSRSSRTWYDQSRPTRRSTTSHEGGRFGHQQALVRDWEDEDDSDQRREADLLSLHEASESGALPRPRRRRLVGGDISGTGISWGSGLSRWTLLKSWWRGSKGRIRLPEDEEEDGFRALGLPIADEANTTFMEGEGDGDAVEIRDTVLAPPVDPPLSPTKSTGTSVSGERDETPEEREARRERRRARRRARELGLSVQDFDQGVIAEPEELPPSAGLVDLEATPRSAGGPRRPRHHKSSSYSSSADSYQADYQAHAQHFSHQHLNDVSGLSVVGEHGDDSFDVDVDALHLARKEARRERRAARAAAGTVEGERPPSSTGSDSSRSRHDSISGAIATSPHTGSSAYLAAPVAQHESKRSRHRGNPSTSTTSTSSSGRVRRPRKQQHLSSPLEEEAPPFVEGAGSYYLAEDGQYYLAPHVTQQQPMYYQDDAGQLRPVDMGSQEGEPRDGYFGDAGEEGATVSQTTTAYDHVGHIPNKAAPVQQEAKDDDEELS